MPGLVARRVGMLGLVALAALVPATMATAQPAGRSDAQGAVAASADPVFVVNAPKNNELTITEKFAKAVELKTRIVRVDGFDPEIIGVSALTPHQIRVQALKPGVTTLVLVDEFGASWTVEIFVVGDVRHLQAYLTQLFPRSSVEAVAVKDAVVLRGWVDQPEHITQMVDVAERFFPTVLNQMRVGGVQQVALKVQVMEVQRAKIRRVGLNFIYKNKNSYITNTVGDLTPLAAATAVLPAAGGAITPPTVDVAANTIRNAQGAFGIVGPQNVFQSFVEALKSEAMLKILAEPELVTTNGRPASMLAGGEFPIIVPQSLGTTSIQWREFGVRMEAVPIILGAGRVRLDLQPEVSERDFTNAVQVNGLTVPGLTTRRVNTQVEMKFGETFMLAGLLSMRNTSQCDKVPFLGELPYIGSAFRRVRYDEAETELVIMVTPELVQAVDPSTVPPGGPGLFTDVPTDRELFHSGFLEVPKYGDDFLGSAFPPGAQPGPAAGPNPAPAYGPPSGPLPRGAGPLPRGTISEPLPRGMGPLPRGTGPAPRGQFAPGARQFGPAPNQFPPGQPLGEGFPGDQPRSDRPLNGPPGLIAPPRGNGPPPGETFDGPLPRQSSRRPGEIERTGLYQSAPVSGGGWSSGQPRNYRQAGRYGAPRNDVNVVRSPSLQSDNGKPGLIEP